MSVHLEDKCPGCFYRVDRATDALYGVNQPKPGDVTLCLNCGEPFVYSDNLQMRHMTDEERDEVMAMEEVIKGMKIIKERGPIERASLNPNRKRI